MKLPFNLFLLLAASISTQSLYPASHYYDDVGRLIQIAYPEGSGVTYVYDDNDNLLSATTVTIPAPPENLVTSANEEGGINLSWEAADGTDNYLIYRRRGSNLAWQEIATVPSGTILFFDTTTAPNTEFIYRIVAAGTDGLSAYSEASSAVSPELNIFSARLLQSAAGSNLYEIRFPGKLGSVYRIEYSNSLQPDEWSLQGYRVAPTGQDSQSPIPGIDGEIILYFSVDESTLPRFFRVTKDPE